MNIIKNQKILIMFLKVLKILVTTSTYLMISLVLYFSLISDRKLFMLTIPLFIIFNFIISNMLIKVIEKTKSNLKELDSIVNDNESKTCELFFNGALSMSGTLGLLKEDGITTPISLQTGKYNLPNKGYSTVKVIYNRMKSELLLISWSRNFVIGKILDTKSFDKEIKKFLIFSKSIIGVISLVFVIIFITLVVDLFDSKEEFINAQNSLDWQYVEGRVIKSDFWFVKSSKNRRAGYKNNLKYEYFVNGKQYVGDMFYFSMRETIDEVEMQRLKREYLNSNFVKIYYDKDNPEISILEQGHQEDAEKQYKNKGIALLIIVITIFLTLLLFYYMLVSRQKKLVNEVLSKL
ncbi:MAG: DUF3592 domain-containing protein [Candidatus Delongbacteria bacterium]|nr:DUF3592 domain-containing protein [Candidatus Delongbacteria bacterium]MBN2835212.1 DUF3592 domain-containing protein [Candidatus Delongbacteria bacterium]